MPDLMAPYLQDLKNELSNDPKIMGYSGKSEEEIADLLNTIGGSNETVNAGVLESYEIVNALDASEITALTDAERTILGLIISAGKVDSSNPQIQAIFLNIFPTGTSRANLIALSKRSVNRAEKLGYPITIKPYHIARAQEL